MKAVIINRYGGAEVLEEAAVEKPQIRSNEALVKVCATSVNPIDWKNRSGLLKSLTRNKFPFILGFDVSGEVVEVGKSVTRFRKDICSMEALRACSEELTQNGKLVITVAS